MKSRAQQAKSSHLHIFSSGGYRENDDALVRIVHEASAHSNPSADLHEEKQYLGSIRVHSTPAVQLVLQTLRMILTGLSNTAPFSRKRGRSFSQYLNKGHMCFEFTYHL